MFLSTRGLITEGLTEQGYTVGATVVDDGGGGARGTAIPGGTVACRIDAMSAQGDEGITGGRISDRSTHLITLPPETAVTTEDQFYVSGRGTYEVTAVREHTGEFATVIEAVERA